MMEPCRGGMMAPPTMAMTRVDVELLDCLPYLLDVLIFGSYNDFIVYNIISGRFSIDNHQG